MPSDISRRRLLAMGAGTAGTAAAVSLLPPSLRAALAAEPRSGGLDAIEHVVFLMQENRSFDHYFGTLRGVRGFADRNAIQLPSGGSVFEQPSGGDRTVLPFPVREAAAAQHEDLQYIGDLDHSWNGGASAWHDGWTDNWVAAKSGATMAYYDRQDIPLHYELADTFTICDAYHSSIHSSTSPNRNHFVSGWTGYEANGARAVGNDAYDEDRHPGYTWRTYAERLEDSGHSWRTYQEWDNFTDNNLEFFANFKAVARKALAKTGDYRSLTAFYGAVAGSPVPEQDRLLALLDEGVAGLTAAERGLFERALRRGRPGSVAGDFRADVAAGRLPQVSWLVPSAADSEHPSVSSPVASATIVYRVLDALASHPEVWQRTAVFLTYDENDGFFDHVPPPVPPAGTDEEHWQGRPTGLGIRVPMIVISPWSVGGYACSEVFDHTSTIRFLERRFGVREPNITGWRRQVCGDLTSAFDFGAGRPQPPVEQPGPIPPFTGRWRPEPPSDQRMPTQEPGTRGARPLPYQPDAQGALDGGTFRVRLTNAGTSSVHFALYPYAGEFPVPQHKDVAREEGWAVPVNAGTYRFTITGPNGFRREFAGAASASAGSTADAGSAPRAGSGEGTAEVASRIDSRGRRLVLTLVNGTHEDAAFTVGPNAYGRGAAREPRTITVRAGGSRSVAVPCASTHGWYDVTVARAADPAFRRRLMGHIENGAESVTG